MKRMPLYTALLILVSTSGFCETQENLTQSIEVYERKIVEVKKIVFNTKLTTREKYSYLKPYFVYAAQEITYQTDSDSLLRKSLQWGLSRAVQSAKEGDLMETISQIESMKKKILSIGVLK